MVVIEILQKTREESARLMAQIDSGASRLYEITTAGTIVERTHQMRSFYALVVEQLGEAIHLLGVREGARRD